MLRVPATSALRDGDAVLVLVRPEEVTLQAQEAAGEMSEDHGDNHIVGVIELRTFLGPFTRFHVRVNDRTTLTADIPSQQARDFFVAQHVVMTFPPQACQVLPLDVGEAKLVEQAETEAV